MASTKVPEIPQKRISKLKVQKLNNEVGTTIKDAAACSYDTITVITKMISSLKDFGFSMGPGKLI